MTATIAILGLEEPVVERLRSADFSCDELDPSGGDGALPEEPHWCAAVVGPQTPDPLAAVRSVVRRASDLPVLVLCSPERRREIIAQLRTEPRLGRQVRTRDVADTDGLLLDLAGAARRRQTRTERRRASERAASERASSERAAPGLATPSSGLSPTQQRQLEQRTREAIVEIARGVLESLDVEAVLERVLESARELTGARYAALGVLDEPKRELERFLTSGLDLDERRRIGALPRGRGVLGELIEHPVPLRVSDVAEHPRSYGFPAGHPPMRSFLGVPILVRGEPFGNLYLTDKEDAAEFDEADESAVVSLAELAGIAIDHAHRFSGSEQRRMALQQTVDALDATIQIANAVGGETDLEAILELVAKRGRALVSARTLVIQLLVGEELVVAEAAGEAPREIIGLRTCVEKSISRAALRTRRTQRLDDQLNRSRFEQHGLGQAGLTATDGLMVPLIFRGRTYGVLVALDRVEDGSFSASDERLLESFAASAATAVATAQSVAVERRRERLAAAEAERTRWARELHDETLQAMANLRLVLSAAQTRGDRDSLARATADAIEQLSGDIANLRSLITDLRPAALDALGVDAAIMGLGDRLARGGLRVDVTVALGADPEGPEDRLIPELEAAIYRIVQEALTNALRHGDARTATVEVREVDRRIVLRVSDDGRGFDPRAVNSGFGLAGMRERVELLDGSLQVRSAPGTGTTISAELPALRRDEAALAPALDVRRG